MCVLYCKLVGWLVGWTKFYVIPLGQVASPGVQRQVRHKIIVPGTQNFMKMKRTRKEEPENLRVPFHYYYCNAAVLRKYYDVRQLRAGSCCNCLADLVAGDTNSPISLATKQ